MAPNASPDPVAAVRPPPGRFYFWVLGLAGVIGLLLFESLFGGRGLMPADGVLLLQPWRSGVVPQGVPNMLLTDQFLMFIPQREFEYQQFWQGHFPLWNPYLDCGLPNLGSCHGAQLFPVSLLLLPLSPFYAAGLAAFIKLFLAGWFTMLYLRQLGASNSGAFLSGLVFCLSGFMIVWLGHPHVNCALWLPLLLWLTERFFQCLREQAPVGRVWVGWALAFGCVLLGGHPPTMIHLILFSGAYFLFRWAGHWRKYPPLHPSSFILPPSMPPMIWWGGAVLVGGLLAAPAILPFLEYDQVSSESASSVGLQRGASILPLKALIYYLLPHLSGCPVDGWGDTLLGFGGKDMPNFNERTGYVGVLPWLFAVYAAFRGGHPVIRFHALAILAGLLVVFGLPPLPTILGALPVLKSVNHIRLLLVVGFCVAVLAGMGWDRFQSEVMARRKLRFVAVFWGGIGLVLLGVGVEVARRGPALTPDRWAYLQPQLLLLGGSLLISMIWFLPSFRHFRHRGWVTGLTLGWVALDLLAFARGYNPSILHAHYYPSPPAITWLEQHAGHSRFIGQDSMLLPNVSQFYGLRDVRGCDFTTVRRYEELITGRAGDFFFYNVAAAVPPVMPLLGVQYWLSFHAPNPDPGRFELVYSNEISIYRYLPAHERAIVVYQYEVESDPRLILRQVRADSFDPARKLLLEAAPAAPAPMASPAPTTPAVVQMVSDQADSVTLAAQLPQPGFLLLLDTWFPGWTATVNGQAVPVLRADYNFRAVPLPAGSSTVQFAYRPASFRVGLLLAGAGWLILGMVFCSPRFKRLNLIVFCQRR